MLQGSQLDNWRLWYAMCRIALSGYFDAHWYRNTYPDVPASWGGALKHYARRGAKERRSPGPRFNTAWYVSQYPDVAAAGVDPLLHYLRHGVLEGRRPIPACGDSDFDSAMKKVASSGFFNPQWYIETYRDVPPSYMTPLEHYVRYGAFEGRSPGPEFDGSWYLAQYPDIDAAKMNPLLHFIDHGAAEGRKPRPPPGIIKAARATLDSICDLDPDLYTESIFYDLARLPIVDGSAKEKAYLALRSLINSLRHSYDFIVFMPWLVHGGADIVAVHAVRALLERYGRDSTLVVVTDHDRLDARNWLPDGVTLSVVSSFAPGLTPDERTVLVELLIQALQPHCVLNVNSKACWDAFVRRGQAFSTFTQLSAAIFCRDFTPDGLPAGYADSHLPKCLVSLTAVYLDNESFGKELIERFGLTATLAEKLTVLRQPVNAKGRRSAKRKRINKKKLAVFWAGRFCRQKNVELLCAIANIAPRISFDVWGRGDAEEGQLRNFASAHDNFVVRGSYPCFDALPIDEYDVCLYTSLWDGIPNLLLEAGAAGIPIVASDVGGIREVVTSETGWLISDYRNPTAYITALSEVDRDPDEAMRRCDNMLSYLEEKHSWAAYISALSKPPGLLIGR